MALSDEEMTLGLTPRRAAPAHELGQPLDALSLRELEERVALMRAEIARLESAAQAKRASKNAADAFFR